MSKHPSFRVLLLYCGAKLHSFSLTAANPKVFFMHIWHMGFILFILIVLSKILHTCYIYVTFGERPKKMEEIIVILQALQETYIRDEYSRDYFIYSTSHRFPGIIPFRDEIHE